MNKGELFLVAADRYGKVDRTLPQGFAAPYSEALAEAIESVQNRGFEVVYVVEVRAVVRKTGVTVDE